MDKLHAVPRVYWEYVGDELAVFWDSPYGHGKEKIASFWWPLHPPEATTEVEAMFEVIANRLISGIELFKEELEEKDG